MPILLQYGPIGAGAAVAGNIASFKEAQIREQERQRNQQALEEQQRYDQAMARQREQDRLNEDYKRQSLDLEGQRISAQGDYRNEQLGQRAMLADTPAEKWRRLKERLTAQGDMQGARLAADKEMQARREDFQGTQNQNREASINDRYNQGLEQRQNEQQGVNDRFGQSLEQRKAEEADRNNRDQLSRDLRQRAIDKRDAAHNAMMTARDAQTRSRAAIALADSQHELSRQDLNDWEEKYRREKIGDADWQTKSYWEGEHQRLQKVEYEAQKALVDAKRAMFEPTQQPTAAPNVQFRRDTPQAFQNDPMQEGPVVGAGGAGVGAPPSMIQGQSNDPLNEANGSAQAAGIDPRLAAFQEFYNSLPPGSPYTAPDGTQRMKKQ